jgi:CheY-like chemotaxis protein/HPt (histidine-containing phosphotransfer) domain-containing protein
MDDFIIKPFDAATLISSVIHHTVSARIPTGEIHSEPQRAKGWLAWPKIDGIDMEHARNHLFDDLPLFRASLQGFLSDFCDMAVPSPRSVPLGLADQASRLHKLKGGAAILGAKAIQHLAAEAEAACVAGEAARAGEFCIELVAHLDALRSSAARAFESACTSELPMTAPGNIGLEPQSIAAREQIDAPCRNHGRPDSTGLCRVLLVDDDDIARTHFTNLLERSSYHIGEAASGREAVRALRGGDYQIVITDWKMPGMSGLELCRELRADTANRDLYVIVLTMSDRQEDEDLCRAAGADAYVLKSAPNEEVIACMAAAQRITQQRSFSRNAKRV